MSLSYSTADVAATGGRLAGPIAKGLLDFMLTGPGAEADAANEPADLPGRDQLETLLAGS